MALSDQQLKWGPGTIETQKMDERQWTRVERIRDNYTRTRRCTSTQQRQVSNNLHAQTQRWHPRPINVKPAPNVQYSPRRGANARTPIRTHKPPPPNHHMPDTPGPVRAPRAKKVTLLSPRRSMYVPKAAYSPPDPAGGSPNTHARKRTCIGPSTPARPHTSGKALPDPGRPHTSGKALPGMASPAPRTPRAQTSGKTLPPPPGKTLPPPPGAPRLAPSYTAMARDAIYAPAPRGDRKSVV